MYAHAQVCVCIYICMCGDVTAYIFGRSFNKCTDIFVPAGNMNNLTARSTLWSKIKESLAEQDAIGDQFPLCCQFHREKQYPVKTLADFRKVS